jgi:hypothetical protein
MKSSKDRSSSASASPTGYAGVARRLTSWTSNLLATAIVLVLALGGGRQMVRWYQEEPLPPDRLNGSGPSIASMAEPLALELSGGGSILKRESLRGEQQAVLERLQRFCREVVTAAEPPTQQGSNSEQRFLASLAERQPIDEAHGAWRIYSLPGAMPIVVGVLETPSLGPVSQPPLAEPLRRVLAWGIAVPSGQNAWVLYQHQLAADGVAGTLDELPIPLPAGSHRTLTITGQGGERTIGIVGNGDAGDWQRHFDHHMKRQGWQSRGWQAAGRGWHARYEQANGRVAEVHFAGEGRNQLRGLVIIGPGGEARIEAT